jgi:hypothetical protein
MIPVLAALLHHIKTHKLVEDYKAYEAIRKWYWGSVFLEHYAGAVESTTYQDFRDLLNHFEDPSIQPGVFSEIEKNILADENFSLHSVSRRSAVYKGVINLLAIRGAKDFRTGDAIAFYILEDHHIFPESLSEEANQRHWRVSRVQRRRNQHHSESHLDFRRNPQVDP